MTAAQPSSTPQSAPPRRSVAVGRSPASEGAGGDGVAGEDIIDTA
ncbi:hypothetical protein Ksed_26550 [Kytococcus sedentarius DSM 20547]|uniref:Uncharacterized protein n=1 Tax=Kytococcus sedentarius (strain ATCC 14392 / DSM 20547 / JCM 11482 / CCUG 33030 / NBRC 15357 / NCTC 11040 / CCM 314 / 541) TaxID=478801 RepID=C7NGT3_KYTSD|nr:hypothetical protein Ksed_26550 [Kytococcus sedentarius DSM 20547]